MIRRKICFVTGTRADFGLLAPVMQGVKSSDALSLQTVATGMHLSPEFGLTYTEIENEGFLIDDRVEMLLSSDSPVGVTKAIGLGIIGFADTFARLKPDMVMLLGDRFEIMAAAQAALMARIPIAHIAGGDTTEGAIDESIRHCLTKMAHLHFVTNEIAAQRVRQLGENPNSVHLVGSPGLDRIRNLQLIDREGLERHLEFSFREKNILVTFHPATLDSEPATHQFQELLDALSLMREVGIIFTYPNADASGRALFPMIEAFVREHPNAMAYKSLGQLRYLSTIAQVDVVIGNSSSGLYEVPSFKKPTVNIGDRQKGRLQAASIVNCEPIADDILRSLKMAMTMDCKDVVNPYGDGHSTARILAVLQGIQDFQGLLRKKFFEL